MRTPGPIHICDKGETVAIILFPEPWEDGVHFLTPPDYPLQMGYHRRVGGTRIRAHAHGKIRREVSVCQEFLFIKSGKVLLSLFGMDDTSLGSWCLPAGSAVLLAQGGHGLEMLEDSEIVEIKQGPYLDHDKHYLESESHGAEDHTGL